MNIEKQLEAAIMQEFKNLQSTAIGSDEYKMTADVLTKLIDRAIEIENRKFEREIKNRESLHEERDRWIKNGIAVAGIVVPCLVTIWGTKVSLKFEEEGTITTIVGRGFINKLLPKK